MSTKSGRSDSFYIVIGVVCLIVVSLIGSHSFADVLDHMARLLFPGVYP